MLILQENLKMETLVLYLRLTDLNESAHVDY